MICNCVNYFPLVLLKRPKQSESDTCCKASRRLAKKRSGWVCTWNQCPPHSRSVMNALAGSRARSLQDNSVADPLVKPYARSRSMTPSKQKRDCQRRLGGQHHDSRWTPAHRSEQESFWKEFLKVRCGGCASGLPSQVHEYSLGSYLGARQVRTGQGTRGSTAARLSRS